MPDQQSCQKVMRAGANRRKSSEVLIYSPHISQTQFFPELLQRTPLPPTPQAETAVCIARSCGKRSFVIDFAQGHAHRTSQCVNLTPPRPTTHSPPPSPRCDVLSSFRSLLSILTAVHPCPERNYDSAFCIARTRSTRTCIASLSGPTRCLEMFLSWRTIGQYPHRPRAGLGPSRPVLTLRVVVAGRVARPMLFTRAMCQSTFFGCGVLYSCCEPRNFMGRLLATEECWILLMNEHGS